MEHAATRAERRQEAATQSQPEFDSLAVGLPAQGWLAKPAAPETERLALNVCNTGCSWTEARGGSSAQAWVRLSGFLCFRPRLRPSAQSQTLATAARGRAQVQKCRGASEFCSPFDSSLVEQRRSAARQQISLLTTSFHLPQSHGVINGSAG